MVKDALRKIKGLQTKKSRIEKRRRRGTLSDNRVRPQTLKRYKSAAFSLLTALETTGFPTTWLMLDEAISRIVEKMYNQGDQLFKAETALAAAQFFIPGARGQLNLSWSLVAAWRR